MIFVTVGTEKFAFDRLLIVLENAMKNKRIEGEVFAQTGSSKFNSSYFPCVKILSPKEWAEWVERSDVVVSHAGQGSISSCLKIGKIPIVFPRLAAFKEHVDDHQMELAKKLGSAGRVLVAYTEDELIQKIRDYKSLTADTGTCVKPYIDIKSKKMLLIYLRAICALTMKRKAEAKGLR